MWPCLSCLEICTREHESGQRVSSNIWACVVTPVCLHCADSTVIDGHQRVTTATWHWPNAEVADSLLSLSDLWEHHLECSCNKLSHCWLITRWASPRAGKSTAVSSVASIIPGQLGLFYRPVYHVTATPAISPMAKSDRLLLLLILYWYQFFW